MQGVAHFGTQGVARTQPAYNRAGCHDASQSGPASSHPGSSS